MVSWISSKKGGRGGGDDLPVLQTIREGEKIKNTDKTGKEKKWLYLFFDGTNDNRNHTESSANMNRIPVYSLN